VGTKFLTLDESDSSVAQCTEMLESEMCGEIVIEDDVGHAGNLLMTGDGNSGKRVRSSINRINSDDAFGGALLKNKRIFINEVSPVPMTHYEIEIAFVKEMVFDPRQNGGRVSLADLWDYYADRETPLLTKKARHEVGPVIEFKCGGADPFLGRMRNRLRARRPVDHQGN
jgi:hypothetical protein